MCKKQNMEIWHTFGWILKHPEKVPCGSEIHEPLKMLCTSGRAKLTNMVIEISTIPMSDGVTIIEMVTRRLQFKYNDTPVKAWWDTHRTFYGFIEHFSKTLDKITITLYPPDYFSTS